MKLVQFGIPRNPERTKDYYDISFEECKSQTGYLENKGKNWKLYMSYMHVISIMQNGDTKYYFYGSFEACLEEIKKLTGEKVEIISRYDIE